jgi:serine/threonine protein kinase
VIEGLAYCHEKGVAHRDIKLENIFLSGATEVKIADFGLMKIFSGTGAEAMKTKCGTSNYMAPEIQNIKEGETYEGKPVDIFAVGTMLFMMLSGKQPFNEAGDIWH